MTELAGPPAEIVIRAAKADEVARVGELTLAAYRDGGHLRGPTTNQYATSLADATDRFREAELLVAVDSAGTILGTVTIAVPGSTFGAIAQDGELEFRMLAVDKRAGGQGIGELLTRAVLRRAAELGVPRVVLCSSDTMAQAHRLYERLGFRRMPERDWRPGPDVLLLAYELELPSID